MKVIGLTGGTGSGKSIVCTQLKKRNAYIIDADKIAHDIIKKGQPAYEKIVSYFGEEILDEESNIVRKKLGAIVFSDKEKLDFLNKCTHQYISEKINSFIQTIKKCPNKYQYIILDAPLLIESNLTSICDEIWVVYAKEEDRLKRIMQRDNITYEQAKNRILSQKRWEEYKKYADIIIDNSRDLKFLENQLNTLFM